MAYCSPSRLRFHAKCSAPLPQQYLISISPHLCITCAPDINVHIIDYFLDNACPVSHTHAPWRRHACTMAETNVLWLRHTCAMAETRMRHSGDMQAPWRR